jgi:preprotein translocase subunit SecE
MADIDKAEVQKADKTEKKPAPEKKKKVSLGQKIGKFLRDYKSELKKVVWASKEQTLNNTILVAVAVIISGLLIGILDFAFSTGLNALGKLI